MEVIGKRYNLGCCVGEALEGARTQVAAGRPVMKDEDEMTGTSVAAGVVREGKQSLCLF